jgi:hypothetical protein
MQRPGNLVFGTDAFEGCGSYAVFGCCNVDWDKARLPVVVVQPWALALYSSALEWRLVLTKRPTLISPTTTTTTTTTNTSFTRAPLHYAEKCS